MKKVSILITLAAFLLFTGTSCLKDKGYENQEYGTNVPDIKAVAFPGASNSPLGFGLDVLGTPQTLASLVSVTLETTGSAESDLSVTLTNTTGTAAAGDIAAYNTANSASLQVLPSSLYTFPTSLTIAKGQKFVNVPIVISSTLTLDPTQAYGIALTITGAPNGYQIAKNMSKVIVQFSIKNKYDGRYRLQGYHNRVPYTFPYDTEIHLVTKGPNSVSFYWPEVSSVGHPIGIGPGNSMSWYGPGIAPVIVFDVATDLVTDVFNGSGGTQINLFTGAGSRLSKFDPATRNITVDWHYLMNPLRAFFDDLTYLGPR